MRTRALGLALALALLALLGLLLRGGEPRRSGHAPRPIEPAPTDGVRLAPAPGEAPRAAERERLPAQAGAEPATLRPTARVHGTLSDAEDGRPLAGLELGLFGRAGRHAGRSAVDGRFAFELEPGTWTFFLEPGPERAAAVEELELAPGEERDLSRSLGPPHVQCVRVWGNELGRRVPLAGASVWWIAAESEALERARWPGLVGLEPQRTDERGRTVVPFADFASHVLLVEREGYLPWSAAYDLSPLQSWLPFSADGCIHVELLELGATLRGRVLDPRGAPLAEALLGLAGAPAQSVRHVDDDQTLVLHPSETSAWTRSAADGSFALALPRLPLEGEAPLWLVACPERAELVHHVAHPLSPAERVGRSAIELRLPRAEEVELEFVDETGAPLDGVASLRDADGFAHGTVGPSTRFDLDPRSAGRRLLTHQGRVRVRHPGGEVRVGLSPGGRWDGREFALEIPTGDELRRLRVVVPRQH